MATMIQQSHPIPLSQPLKVLEDRHNNVEPPNLKNLERIPSTTTSTCPSSTALATQGGQSRLSIHMSHPQNAHPIVQPIPPQPRKLQRPLTQTCSIWDLLCCSRGELQVCGKGIHAAWPPNAQPCSRCLVRYVGRIRKGRIGFASPGS